MSMRITAQNNGFLSIPIYQTKVLFHLPHNTYSKIWLNRKQFSLPIFLSAFNRLSFNLLTPGSESATQAIFTKKPLYGPKIRPKGTPQRRRKKWDTSRLLGENCLLKLCLLNADRKFEPIPFCLTFPLSHTYEHSDGTL